MQKPDFGLIETMRYEPANGLLRLEQHLQRLRSSAKKLGFTFDEDHIRAQLQAHSTGDQALRMRLCLTVDGEAQVTTTLFQPLSADIQWTITIAKMRLNSADPLLRHKTTRRAIYETARAEFGPTQADEVLLLNEKDELCEGTITSLFVDMGDGLLLTPPLECGLLNGVLRQVLLQNGQAKTTILTIQHVQNAKAVFVGNSLRGLIGARLAQ